MAEQNESFITWVLDTYFPGQDLSLLQAPDVLARFGLPNSVFRQYWEQNVRGKSTEKVQQAPPPPPSPTEPLEVREAEGQRIRGLIAEGAIPTLPDTIIIGGQSVNVSWEPLQTAETEDGVQLEVWIPVLPVDQFNLDNVSQLLDNVFITPSDGSGDFSKLSPEDIANLEGFEQQTFNDVSAFLTLQEESFARGTFTEGDLTELPGLRAVLGDLARSLGQGLNLPPDAFDTLTGIKERVPTLTQLGVAGLPRIPITAATRQLPPSEQLRQMQIDLARERASLSPEAFEQRLLERNPEIVQLLSGLDMNAAIDFISGLSDPEKQRFFPQVLGQSFAAGERQVPEGITIPTEFGIREFLSKPENIPLFEQALTTARQQGDLRETLSESVRVAAAGRRRRFWCVCSTIFGNSKALCSETPRPRVCKPNTTRKGRASRSSNYLYCWRR